MRTIKTNTYEKDNPERNDHTAFSVGGVQYTCR